MDFKLWIAAAFLWSGSGYLYLWEGDGGLALINFGFALMAGAMAGITVKLQ